MLLTLRATASLLKGYPLRSTVSTLTVGTLNTERPKTNAKLASSVSVLRDVNSYAESDKQTSTGPNITENDRSTARRAVG